MAVTRERGVFRAGIVLIPGFSLMAFASTVEPLRNANLMLGKTHYAWTHLSPKGGTIASSGGLEVVTTGLAAVSATEFDLVVVCGGLDCQDYRNDKLDGFLRRAARGGALVGSVSTASFILAKAGLLVDRRCTVHWDFREAFAEAYPDLDIRNELFVSDRGILTCAGGTAALDMMLQLIRDRHGNDLANLVSDQFIHGSLRGPADDQRMALRSRLGVSDPLILKAIAIMEAAIEHPLKAEAIAAKVGVSARQLERLFQRDLGRSPTQHYTRVRLERARKLLRQTSLPILEIGVACGFVTASYFAKSYRLHYGVVPSADRQPEAVEFKPRKSRST